MKRSSPAVDPPPQCALNLQEVATLANSPCQGKDDRADRNYSFSPTNRGSGRNPHHPQSRQKREPQCMNQSWTNPTFDNSNTSWEGEWCAPSGTPPIKTDSSAGGFYKNRNPGPYPSSEWSPGDSSASSSVASSYGMMHTPQQSPSNSLSASSFYENNGFYNSSGYNYGQSAYVQPSYGQQHQQYQQSVRMADSAACPYNSNRNPSSCPPIPVKQPVPDYHRRQIRYGLDGMPKVQIKREPEEYAEMDGENFTSLFTKSLTSLYSQDTENAFSDESKPYDTDIMVCGTSTPVPVMEEPTAFQRLHTSSGGQYPGTVTSEYEDARSNFGFYESRNQNCDASAHVVQDMGSDGNQMNSFRYDRPSFDDMHLYASSPTESKAQAKKRKISMPNISPESGFTENRKKTPRIMSFKSDSKWTPNSFSFSEIQIKQEPTDDYNTNDLDGPTSGRAPCKDSSSGSNGNGNGSGKTSTQPSDHPKPPPRKRSPGATCFDRFEKKSTPTNKKVSPLSVYAKVQESIVLNVKCRRYKKRTKPIANKEESACPGREEMENYKRSSLTPDQAAHQVMNELLERVSLFSERNVIDGPDLTQVDAMKVRELLMQFCHRYSLDYRDFEDISCVLKPRIIKDKTAKNSERASAIRKRTSISPVPPDPEPASRTPKSEKGPKKSSSNNSNEDSTPAQRRVLRKLPGRVDRSRPRRRGSSSGSNKAPVVRRRYSTRSSKDVEEVRGSDVDIVIDSSTDRESEAGKEAEVRKKSQRLKNKQPVVGMPARDRSSEKATRSSANRKDSPRTRSREKKVDKPNDSSKAIPKKWTRLHHMNSSESSLRASSVEIVDITKSESPSCSDLSNEGFKKEPPSPSTIAEKVKCRSKRRSTVDSKWNISQRIVEKRPGSLITNKKRVVESKCNKNSKLEDEDVKSSPSGEPTSKLREGSSKRRKGSAPKKLQISSSESPSRSFKKKLIKAESDDTLSESDDDCKVTKIHGKNSSDNKFSSIKESPQKCEKPISSTSPKSLKETAKKQILAKTPQSSACPKLSTEHKKKSAGSSSLSENSSNSDKPSKEKDEKSSIAEAGVSDSKKRSDAVVKENSLSKPMHKSPNKRFSQYNAEIQLNSPESFIIRNIKDEPLSEVTSSSSRLPDKSPDNPQAEIKAARVVRSLPIKKIPRRRSSQHSSESELQVVLTKLPDSQVSFQNGAVPIEVVRMCESREEARTSQLMRLEGKDGPDVGKPPELMRLKESGSVEDEQSKASKKDTMQETSDKPPLPQTSSTPDIPMNLTTETHPAETAVKLQAISHYRYSESEDSDCGLVIDLDRRQSIEERATSPTFQIPDDAADDPLKTNDPPVDQPCGACSEDFAASTTKDSGIYSQKATCDASQKATEDACLLLHLSRSAVPSIPSVLKEMPAVDSIPLESKDAAIATAELKESDKQAKEDESILRTLLLESAGDASSGPSQEILPQSQAGPSSSPNDTKASFDQDYVKYLMNQAFRELSSYNLSDFDDKKIPIEQFTSDINDNAFYEDEDWGNDPRTLKDTIRKLRNEIVFLQFMACQKARERTAICCFKRYKEEVLRRLLKKYASTVQDHVRDWVNGRHKHPAEPRTSVDPNQPVLATSTAHSSISSEDVPPQPATAQQVIQLAYHATVKTDVPASEEALSSQCNENLPPVATMIANATENYGVDMRTVSRNGGGTTKTIVQEVLSARESIYSPAASGSPMPPEQRIGESVQIIQKTLSTTRESTFSPGHSRSPSLPELSPGGKSTHHYSKRVFSCSSSSSQSPPSLQPELRPSVGSPFAPTTSTFQNHYPLSLVVTSSDVKTESSKMLHVPTASGKLLPGTPKNSPRSSPKRCSSSSYSVWSSVHTGRNTTSTSTAIDLKTDRIGGPETSTRRATTVDGHSFMVAPPPTMLQTTFKYTGSQRPRSEAQLEKPLKNSAEKIYHHKNEEEPRTLSYPSIATSCGPMSYGGQSSGCSTAVVSKTSSTINSPPRCMGCGISDAKFLCSGCRKHWYCSAKCQTLRWPDHSRVCPGRQYNSSPSTSYT